MVPFLMANALPRGKECKCNEKTLAQNYTGLISTPQGRVFEGLRFSSASKLPRIGATWRKPKARCQPFFLIWTAP